MVGWVCLWFLVSDTLVKVVAAKTEAASLERRQNNVSQLKTVLSATASERGQVADLFITPGQIVPLIESLEREAGNLGLVLVINRAETSKDKLTLALTATGPFRSLSRFLAAVEHLPYLIKLESVVLGQNESTEDMVGEWSLRLIIDIASFDNLWN